MYFVPFVGIFLAKRREQRDRRQSSRHGSVGTSGHAVSLLALADDRLAADGKLAASVQVSEQ